LHACAAPWPTAGGGRSWRRRARPSSSARRTSDPLELNTGEAEVVRSRGGGEREDEGREGGAATLLRAGRRAAAPSSRHGRRCACGGRGAPQRNGLRWGGDATLRCGSQATQNGFRVWVVCWSAVLIPKYTVQNLFWV